MRLRLVLLTALLLAAPAAAVLPSEQLADPALEARARTISTGIRCVVCQNQSIDDSDATLAHDLRVIVRERLSAGDSDAQTVKYLVDRYGHYVLLKPPFEAATLLLWIGPLAFIGFGLAALVAFVARGRLLRVTPPLDAAESARIDALLAHDASLMSDTRR